MEEKLKNVSDKMSNALSTVPSIIVFCTALFFVLSLLFNVIYFLTLGVHMGKVPLTLFDHTLALNSFMSVVIIFGLVLVFILPGVVALILSFLNLKIEYKEIYNNIDEIKRRVDKLKSEEYSKDEIAEVELLVNQKSIKHKKFTKKIKFLKIITVPIYMFLFLQTIYSFLNICLSFNSGLYGGILSYYVLFVFNFLIIIFIISNRFEKFISIMSAFVFILLPFFVIIDLAKYDAINEYFNSTTIYHTNSKDYKVLRAFEKGVLTVNEDKSMEFVFYSGDQSLHFQENKELTKYYKNKKDIGVFEFIKGLFKDS